MEFQIQAGPLLDLRAQLEAASTSADGGDVLVSSLLGRNLHTVQLQRPPGLVDILH